MQLEPPTYALDDVLITDELERRHAAPRDLAAENSAFVSLAQQMTTDSPSLLTRLVDLATSLCHAGSAGVSLLEPGSSGPGVFRWVALAGAYAPHLGGTTDEHFSPCGVCLQRGAPQLYTSPARFFTYLATASPAIEEALVIPLPLQDGAAGTIWIVSHDDVRFTMRDVIVMTGLAEFTAAALTLQHARSRAEELSRMKDEFLSVVSHELRGPLNTILGWSDLLLAGRMTPERAAHALETIRASAARQTVLVDDLLDTSRIVSGTMRLSKAPVDLEALARAAMADVEMAGAQKNVALRSDIEGALPPFLGDAERLQQIFANLLNNALKFTPGPGLVKLSIRPTTDSVEVRVADTGIGLTPAHLGSVFEPFRQVDTSTTRRQAGLGLGLTIAQRLAELHGGRIHAHSLGEGCGATFVLRLPLSEVIAPPATAAHQQHALTGLDDLTGVGILVVDDDADHRNQMAVALQQAGASVVTTDCPAEALALLSETAFDVLMSDLAMPEEDGWMLIRRVRAGSVSPRIQAVAVSACASEGDRRRALDAGFDRYISKPLDVLALSRVVMEMRMERGAA